MISFQNRTMLTLWMTGVPFATEKYTEKLLPFGSYYYG